MTKPEKIKNLRKLANKTQDMVAYILILGYVAFAAFPLIWLVSTSFRTAEGYLTVPPQLITPNLTAKNYFDILTKYTGPGSETSILIDIPMFTLNSLIYAGGSTFLTLVLAILAGYALARFKIPFRDTIMLTILLSTILPVAVVILPLYKVADMFRLINNRFGLILMYIYITLPFQIWLLQGFFETIPREIEEAAIIDGSSHLGVLVRIILPLSKPGIIAAIVSAFNAAWNQFMFPLIFIKDISLRPLSTGLTIFIGEVDVKWGGLMAASVLSLLPSVVLFIFLRQYFIGGILRGALKG